MRPLRRLYSYDDVIAFFQRTFDKLGVGSVRDPGLYLYRRGLPLRVGQPDRRLGFALCARTADAFGGADLGAALGPSWSRSRRRSRFHHASRKTRFEP